MKSARPKVLHRVAGQPMIEHVLRRPPRARARDRRRSSSVIRPKPLKSALAGHPGSTFVVQEPQLGTAHALLTTEPRCAAQTGTLILLSGDVPLLSPQTLQTLLDRHTSTASAAATVVTAVVDDPHGYGRIVRVRRADCTYCRGEGRHPGRAADPRDQFRDLRVRARRAVRRGPQHRRRERAARVLPAGSRGHLPAAGRGRGNRDRRRIRTRFGASTAASSWRQ